MNFDEPSHVTELRNRVVAFMDEHIYPNEATYFEQSMTLGPWAIWPIVEQLKPVARAAGLWNLFLPSKASKGEIVRQIERVVCLRELVDGIDLSVLPAARVRALARYGLMAKAGALRDLSDRRRRATLIASLVELRAEAADDLGDSLDAQLAERSRQAERDATTAQVREIPRLTAAATELGTAVTFGSMVGTAA